MESHDTLISLFGNYGNPHLSSRRHRHVRRANIFRIHIHHLEHAWTYLSELGLLFGHCPKEVKELSLGQRLLLLLHGVRIK